MTRALGTLLAVAALGYAAICAAMYAFQRSLIYHPQPRAVAAPASTMRLPVDGAELVVTVRPREGPRALVYFGGNAEDVSANLAPFGQAFPDRALYLMHYRGYGGSTGDPTEADNVADGLALFRHVRARHGEVALVGRSLGSGVAVQVARRADAQRLVLVTPYDSLAGIAEGLYPWLPVRWLLRDAYRSGDAAPDIRTPTLLVEAEHDAVIPRASTRRLLGRFAPGVATLAVVEGAGHNDLDRHPAYRQAMQAALR